MTGIFFTPVGFTKADETLPTFLLAYRGREGISGKEVNMKQTIRNIIQLGIKELFGLGRDKLLLGLILYSFTVAIYIGAKSSPDSISNAAIAVVDEDRSPLSQRITDAFLPPMFAPVKSLSQFDIDDAMDHGKYTFIVVFPAGFQEKVLAGS